MLVENFSLSTNPLITDSLMLIVFLSLWIGYYAYTRLMAKKRDSLSNAMMAHRVAAINNVMHLETKITGAIILSNIDKNVSFFASTTLLLLASLTGVLTKANAIQQAINSLPYAYLLEISQVYFRLLVLIGIFVYAYFTLTWSLRQSSFTAVMIGAGNNNGDNNDKAYSLLTAKLMDISAHSANQGLRAYYFSLAVLTWFYHPLAFLVASLIVITVLYRREFDSKTAHTLVLAKEYLPEPTTHQFQKNR